MLAKSLHLVRRPDESGEFADSLFETREAEVGELAEQEVLVRVDIFSCDPTQKIWSTDVPQYMPPVEIGAPMRSGFGGTVIESKNPEFAVGDRLHGFGSWSSLIKADPSKVGWFKVAPGASLEESVASFLCPATAYVGLHKFGKVQAGETVFVTGAAGATGSAVVQMAKAAGARVIGCAGGPDKCAFVKSLGAEECIDYKNENVAARLASICPGEIDVMFDNVGGEQLEAALVQARNFARFVICGFISGYASLGTGTPVPGPLNFDRVLMRRITIAGFILMDDPEWLGKALEAIPTMIKDGTLQVRTHPVHAPFEQAPAVWRNLLQGSNTGKLLHVVEQPGSAN